MLGGKVSILSYDIYRLIRDHDPPHAIHYLWLSLPCRFQLGRQEFNATFSIRFWNGLKTPQSHSKMCWGMPRAARLPIYLADSVNSVNLVLQDLLSMFAPLRSEKSHFFQVTIHENGSLHGQRPIIWAGAGGEPADAQEHLALFQDIILWQMTNFPPFSDFVFRLFETSKP